MDDIRKQIAERATEVASQKAKNALQNSVNTKIRTSFIFALAEFERLFGHLFDENCDEVASAEDYQNLFKVFRKSVLDKGNDQIRNLERELDGYDVSVKMRTYYVKEQ